MKITKSQLRQIIKEELQAVLREGMVDGEGKPPPGPWYEKGKVYELEEGEDIEPIETADIDIPDAPARRSRGVADLTKDPAKYKAVSEYGASLGK